MIVREYTELDLSKIQALHEQSGFDYRLPEMDTFFAKKVVEGDGEIGAAVLMGLMADVYLICNPKWRTPAWRLAAIKRLHEECNRSAMLVGAQEAVAFLPPQVEKFGRTRLVKMGWVPARPDWHAYFHSVE